VSSYSDGFAAGSANAPLPDSMPDEWLAGYEDAQASELDKLEDQDPSVAQTTVQPRTGVCRRCGDDLVWHEGNGGQWVGAKPPRDWVTCNGTVDGPKHVAASPGVPFELCCVVNEDDPDRRWCTLPKGHPPYVDEELQHWDHVELHDGEPAMLWNVAKPKPSHRSEAERLLDLAESCDWTTGVDTPYLLPALLAAGVHALLARDEP
jgi:hypothetical protein